MAGEKVINIISIEAIVCVTELAVHVDAALFVEDAVALVLADPKHFHCVSNASPMCSGNLAGEVAH